MATLSNTDLYLKVLDAIARSGWQVNLNQTIPENKPFLYHVYRGSEYLLLNVHLWNISHGGKSRSETEYRIQIRPRQDETDLRLVEGAVNLLLGWWDDGGIFVGLDLNIENHVRPGKSASKQIDLDALQQAYENGFSTYINKNQEVILAFQPEYFMDYALNVEVLHHFGKSLEDFSIFERSIKSPSQFGAMDDMDISNAERRITLATIKRRIRDNTFRKRVLTVYQNRCAFCGLQLNLVEAAHILPVSFVGSTDETHNGVALCPLHHKAYDHSLVTFDPNYHIVINELKVQSLMQADLGGGVQQFRANLRKLIDLPPDKRDRPTAYVIEQANQIRGWNLPS